MLAAGFHFAVFTLVVTLARFAQSLPIQDAGGWSWALRTNAAPTRASQVDVDLHLSVGISSLARVVDGRIDERQLEITWWSIDGGYQQGDRVVLYEYANEAVFCQADGSTVVETVAIDAEMANASWTRLTTSMPYFEHADLMDERCQHFWAAYVRQSGNVLACNCLRARPHWMSDMKDRIYYGLLRDIYLPGTHDAAAYERYQGLVSNNPATKYAITQNEDLFAQLSFGVRYLDMRIIFRPDNEHRFWTHHGTYILRPLINDTALVREFVSQTDEIVIFDIHGLDNMDAEPDIRRTHKELQQLLVDEFGEYMAPQNLTWEATLGDFWSTGKRLIVTYKSLADANNPLFWPAVQHQWGNVQSLDALEVYLEGVMAKAAHDMLRFAWSSMVELTPTSEDVALDRFDGLRNAADIVNHECSPGPLHPAGQIRVFLTLSPLARSSAMGKDVQQRHIELNWHGNGAQTGDWIGLYEHDPVTNPTLPLRQVPVNSQSNAGYYKTDVQFGFPDLNRQSFNGDECMGFWIGYIRNGATAAVNCLKIRPTWMWDNRESIGSVPLHELFLPGTHNSGSYRPYQGQTSDTVFMRYLICQDEDIYSQLVYGVRYLDIRVGYYPEREEKFWMNHNYARINPLRLLIQDLKTFLQMTNEVVVLDFHRFPVGFSQNVQRNQQIHGELVKLLVQHLGEYMAPYGDAAHASMNDLWAINRTLIVVYADDWTRMSNTYLWPFIPQEWGDKRNVEDLYYYLGAMEKKRAKYKYFWAAMAELTPSTFDVLFRPGEGLRKLADQVARNVTVWYRDLWWSSSSSVAVDFFHSSDIIDIAVDASLKRARCERRQRLVASTAPPDISPQIEERAEPRPIYHGPRSIQLAETVLPTVSQAPATSTESFESTTTTTTTTKGAGRRRRPKIGSTPSIPVTITDPTVSSTTSSSEQ